MRPFVETCRGALRAIVSVPVLRVARLLSIVCAMWLACTIVPILIRGSLNGASVFATEFQTFGLEALKNFKYIAEILIATAAFLHAYLVFRESRGRKPKPVQFTLIGLWSAIAIVTVIGTAMHIGVGSPPSGDLIT